MWVFRGAPFYDEGETIIQKDPGIETVYENAKELYFEGYCFMRPSMFMGRHLLTRGMREPTQKRREILCLELNGNAMCTETAQLHISTCGMAFVHVSIVGIHKIVP